MKEKIGIIFIVISGLMTILGLFSKRGNYIGLNKVIGEHLKLFRNSKKQYVVFYILPLIMSIGITCLYSASKDMYENLMVVVSIFISMLLAIMGIITAKDYSKYEGKQLKRIKEVLNETNNAIVFCVFICILILVVSLIMVIIETLCTEIINGIISAVLFYLVQVLLLNILLVVKRMSKLV